MVPKNNPNAKIHPASRGGETEGARVGLAGLDAGQIWGSYSLT